MNKDYQRQVTDDSLYQDRVDAYLRDEMSQAERAAFEHDLNSDQALREVYELTRAVKRALVERQERHAMMRRWEAERRLREQPVHMVTAAAASGKAVAASSRLPKGWVIALSAAACLMVGFFAIKPLWFNTASAPPPSDAYAYEPDCVTVMGIDDEMDCCYAAPVEPTDIDIINTMIDNGEYASALARTDSLVAVYRNAIAQYDGDKALSGASDEQLETTKQDLYNLTWVRINLLVTLKQYDSARELLREFMTERGQYRDQAWELYHSITRTGTPPKPVEKK